MMKAAFAAWDNRIAPVFDVARQIHLVEAESGKIVCKTQEILADDLPVQKAIRLANLGVGTLVCGAISRPLHELLVAYDIRVIPFVAGDLGEIIQAWVGGRLKSASFAMPGCFGRGRRWFGEIYGINKEGRIVNGKRQGGRGSGAGRGQGQGGQGSGRMGGGKAAGPSGYCVCPQCGQRETHQRGVPCFERKCPKCGTTMIRE